MSKWKSILQESPKDGLEVILLLDRDDKPLIALGAKSPVGFSLDRIKNADTYTVTHWMPLPKLP